jgi:DNA-binding protein HU-beta
MVDPQNMDEETMARAITKVELINAIAAESDLSKADIDKALSGFNTAATKLLKEGKAVTLPGLAKFEARDRPAREVRAPATGQVISKAADKAVKISPLSALKNSINEK